MVERLPRGWRRSSAATVQHMFSVIGSGATAATRVRRFAVAYQNALRVARGLDTEDVLERVESKVRLTVAEFAPRHVFIHAGVVEIAGRALILPGTSFSGKTTLVAELVRRGARYYSDEFAVIDARGRVLPFHKPLSIRDPETHRQTDVSVEEFGLAGSGPIPLGGVLSTSFRAGARWRPEPLSQGAAVLALMEHAVAARSQPARVLKFLKAATATASAYRTSRSEADEAARRILALFG